MNNQSYNDFMVNVESKNESIKIRGIIYRKKQQCLFVILKPQYTRMSYLMPLKEMIHEANLIKQCHPLEVFSLSIFACLESNNALDEDIKTADEIEIDVDEGIYPRMQPLVQILELRFGKTPSILLGLKHVNVTKEVPLSNFAESTFLINALSPNDALIIAYHLAEEQIKLKIKENS